MRRNELSKQSVVFFPPCKTWACPECAERNKSRWKHRVMYGVDHYQRQGKEFSFVTLTLGGRYKAREDSIRGWRVVWPRVYDRHSRKFGRQPYTVLPECHRNGRVHLHLIIAGDANKRWWKDNVWGCGGGYIADRQQIKSVGSVASYVVKYITKAVGLKRWPPKFKRIRLSHYWPSVPEKPTDEQGLYTVLSPAQLDWTVAWLWRMGYHVANGVTGDLIEMVDLTD